MTARDYIEQVAKEHRVERIVRATVGHDDLTANEWDCVQMIYEALLRYDEKRIEELGDKKYTIQRSKGLGENDADMMWLTTMNPKTRRLIQIRPTDAEATAAQFDMLLGDNLQGRKEHIATDGHLFLDMTDLS